MKRWYVVYTRAGMERLALGHLERQDFTAYLPQHMKERRRDAIKVPLFPRYLFVSFDAEADQWRSITGTHGVSYLITMGEKPSAVPIGIVEAIHDRENTEGLVEVEEPCPYEAGEVVEITRGAFVDQTGIFKCGDAKRRVTLLLSLLGRQMEVQLPPNAIRSYA
jgi:transcriptional antiterminator RfaH